MANSKKRCRQCKSYKAEESMVKTPNNAYFCNHKCAELYAYKNKEKGRKIKEAKQKKDFQLSDRKIRKTALKAACHAYIRERDKDKLCPCCNEPLGSDFHAGHFLESGNHPQIRYDEDNIHGQRLYCNKFKGGDSGDYEKNLRIRIGDERVDRLLSMKFGKCTMTTDDMIKLENYFKQKLKDLL